MNGILRVAAGGVALLVASYGVFAVSADNSNTQSAANSAVSSQSATAISGDSAATNGSTATSGGAVATSYLSTIQTILQRAHNMTDDCDCNNANAQDASQAMEKAQQATAVSGMAAADAQSESASGEVAAILEEVEQQVADQLAENVVESAPADEEPPADGGEGGGEAP